MEEEKKSNVLVGRAHTFLILETRLVFVWGLKFRASNAFISQISAFQLNILDLVSCLETKFQPSGFSGS
jgi:hypothetical protein